VEKIVRAKKETNPNIKLKTVETILDEP